ncbi:hypothetical protein BJX61DRAFT_532876 [Aspergillus egyptiacus]|nr:hypothetical protein BJX61DRAFT_532876 [Aspergillus egyptiacus]
MRPPDDDEPQDWWFASTAIPLIAAATGPLANLMSIAALVSPWRNNIRWAETGVDGTTVEVGYADPRWSIALNATSLACGLVGNFFLLCNFTRKVRYIIALPVSISLWLLSTAILIGLTAALHVYHSPTPPDQVYSQAYWSAVISAVLYFLLSAMLMVNMLGYFLGHYPQNFALTDDQRTLILQTLALVVWLAIGGAIFSRVIGIPFSEALYFSDVTILTLGFGDITSSDAVGRGLIFPYAVIGMVMLGLVVSSIHRFAQEIHRGNVVMNHIERKRKAVAKRSQSQSQTEIDYQRRHTRRRPLLRSTISVFSREGEESSNQSQLPARMEENERLRFNAMRTIQAQTARFRRWSSLLMSLLAFTIVLTCGAAVFWALEKNWTYPDALYFGFCCLLTIGYGDFTPETNAGRPFFIVWSLVAVPTMTTLISKMSDTLVDGYNHATNIVARWTLLPQSGQYSGIPTWIRHHLTHPSENGQPQTSTKQQTLPPEPEEKGHQPRRIPQSPSPSPSPSPDDPTRKPHRPPSDPNLAAQLAQAIQQTAKDSLSGKAKKYSYEEWASFALLIRFTIPDGTDEMLLTEDEYGLLHWDWIGEDSPLLAEQTEPEWVFDRLCESLLRYLAGQGRGGVHETDETRRT